MFSIKEIGTFRTTEKWLKRISEVSKREMLIAKYAQEGVAALAAATPKDTGGTANCWKYEIKKVGNQVRIIFRNTKVVRGVPIAIILQYGHGTGTGGYVEGRDYINPTIRPLFDKLAKEAWEEVTKV